MFVLCLFCVANVVDGDERGLARRSHASVASAARRHAVRYTDAAVAKHVAGIAVSRGTQHGWQLHTPLVRLGAESERAVVLVAPLASTSIVDSRRAFTHQP